MSTSTILKRMLVLFCLLYVHSSAFSQSYTSHWLFGEFGMEFQKDTILIRNDFAPHDNRGAGIISNEQGELLLYTDGFKAWNSQHDTMPNGGSLLINHLQHSIHESLVVRWPGSESLFLIFTVDPYNGQEASGLYYSIVDLGLDGGLGDITVKGEKLLDIVSNKITAVLHNNRQDVWLITHEYNTNNYYAYLVSDDGIAGTPVISPVGPSLSSSFYGQLKASPDGRRVACSHEEVNGNQFVLFDFDDLTGILSNPMTFPLPESIRPADGIEFSSDASKLLVYQTGSTGESGLYQFDLNSPVYEDILNSRILLLREQNNSFVQMQLAENGSIYLTKGGGGGGTGYLGVIHNPNAYGTNCDVRENGLFLEGASAFAAKTPNFNQSYFFRTDFTLDHTCQSSPINFQITNENRLDSVRWHFGEGSTSIQMNPAFEYQESGEYTVQLLAYYVEKTDTISRQINIDPVSVIELGNDTSSCPDLKIGVDDNFISYLWSTGETYHTIHVDTEGWYKLSVENLHGCISSDSIHVTLYDLPDPQLPDTIDLAGQDSVQLNAGVFQSYDWSTGDTTRQIYVSASGWYSVMVENEYECQAASSVYITDGSQPGGPQERTGWEIINPKPSLMAGKEVYFLDEQNGFIITENELLRTRDGGESWSWYMELSSGRHIAFSNSIGYIVGADGAIYKSTHNGVGWNKLTAGFNDDLNRISVLHPDTVLITGDNKLFVSHNGGQSWEIRPIPGVDIEASQFTSSLTGHVACKDGIIMKTTDGGLSWYTTESVNHIPSDFFDIYFVTPELGFASRAHNDLLRTIDGGESWVVVDVYLEAAFDIHFVNESEGYVAGRSGTTFKTLDGGLTWDRAGFQSLIGDKDLYGIYFINKNKGFAVGQRGMILQTTDAGSNWEEYAPSYNEIYQIVHTSPQTLYAPGEKLFKSIDGGQTWEALNTGIPDIDDYNVRFIEGHFFSADEFYVIASAGEISMVIKSTDGGQSFELLKSDDKNIRATSIHFLDPQSGYVCNSYSSYGSGLHKTVDGGLTWEYLSAYRFRDIYFVNENVGFALMADQLFQTNDGGYNWEQTVDLNMDLEMIHFANDSVGYISGGDGLVLKTTDRGISWQELYTGHIDNYGLHFKDQDIGFVTGDYNALHTTHNGGQTWETQYLPVTVRSVFVSDDYEVFVAGANGVILKNASELDEVSVSFLEVEQLSGNAVLLQATIHPRGKILNPVYFDYGLNGIFSDSVKAQPYTLDPNVTQTVSAEIDGLEMETLYNLRIRAIESETVHYSDTITFTSQWISGTNDLPDAPEVILFPNPARDILNLLSSTPMETVRIFDIHGRVLKNTVYRSQLDISGLKPGQYIINIYGENSIVTGRFLKE